MALHLPRLPTNQRIAESNGIATMFLSLLWEKFAAAIEKNVNSIQAALDAAGIATAQAAVAVAAAEAAQVAAADAQASGDAAGGDATAAAAAAAAAAKEASIVNSGTTGLTMTATDAGTSVTVSISAHNRMYGDGTSVAVNGGSITGLPYSSSVRVYYDQASRAGGAVTYQFTVDPAAPPIQSGDRHSVGAVATPAALAAAVAGRPLFPRGYVDLR